MLANISYHWNYTTALSNNFIQKLYSALHQHLRSGLIQQTSRKLEVLVFSFYKVQMETYQVLQAGN